jgi:hypothetical protein
MTTARLAFNIAEWIGSDFGDEADRMTAAAIRIVLGSEVITRLEDREAKTVRETARVSAYRLAYWLAENWWRLRWEPESGTGAADPDWAMSHRLTGAGGGYIWPNMTFASDGLMVRVSTECTRLPPTLSPVEYLAVTDAFLSASEFEDAVDSFVNQVIQRIRELDLRDPALTELWPEVRREREDVDLTRRRRLEARLGFDPDEGPPGLVDAVLSFAERFGGEAIEEIAVARRSERALEDLGNLAAERAAAEEIEVPGLEDLRNALEALKGETLQPWQLGERLADRARGLWGLGPGPIGNDRLAGIAGASPSLFDENAEIDLPDSLDATAFRDTGGRQRMRIAIRSTYPENRRFRFARLLVDPVVAGFDERLLPATRAYTARQKIQRAFAGHLLCPYEELRAMLPASVTGEDIDDAARHFRVSSRVISTMLVNKGALDRDQLLRA